MSESIDVPVSVKPGEGLHRSLNSGNGFENVEIGDNQSFDR
ncbi:MAG: hypothetical protein AAF353_10575 [Pseudomonadota bacterium]